MIDLPARSEHGRRERLDALARERRHQDVGGGVQIVLRVPADELFVLGEGDVTLEDARTHSGARLIGLARVLGELQRGATMADREIALLEGTGGALLQLTLEAAVFHLVDEEERTRTELHASIHCAGDLRRSRVHRRLWRRWSR